ncbi:LuxR family transcriptional regulator [Serratia fonticola]|uniref:LuxR family transcriptional regulator n=1 Tax=Serratia fonticola TaxID=47917 RepID=UPI0024DE4DF8|nr:LuxR C-terminal-related transcriptional regulator [Serratia fonticola]MDK2375042.1 LuxR C-terminal-related transcriptional regulator [Serratia fonticola]
MYEIQSMNNDHPTRSEICTLVFFTDFVADIGIKYMLNNISSSNRLEYFYRDMVYRTEQYVMPIHELLDSLLMVNCTQPKNKIIFLTEGDDPILLRLLASFDMFYFLSKKESLQFIQQAFDDPVDVFEQHASPCIINKIRENWRGERLTHKQRLILNQLAKSLSPTEIGRTLGVHLKTISTHKINIMKKLGYTPWQFTQLLMKLGEVRKISTIKIKTSNYQSIRKTIALPERRSMNLAP